MFKDKTPILKAESVTNAYLGIRPPFLHLLILTLAQLKAITYPLISLSVLHKTDDTEESSKAKVLVSVVKNKRGESIRTPLCVQERFPTPSSAK